MKRANRPGKCSGTSRHKKRKCHCSRGNRKSAKPAGGVAILERKVTPEEQVRRQKWRNKWLR